MNRETDNERLFADALAEGGPAGFREALLGKTLRLARRRRHFRQMRRAGAALLAVGLITVLFWPRAVPHGRPPVETQLATYQLINSHPLPASAVVTTQPFVNQIVASVQTANVITTAQAHDGLREINDDELLALAPAPAMLVRLGPHSAELVLANQEKTDLQ
jgi:hypothetical protein